MAREIWVVDVLGRTLAGAVMTGPGRLEFPAAFPPAGLVEHLARSAFEEDPPGVTWEGAAEATRECFRSAARRMLVALAEYAAAPRGEPAARGAAGGS